MDSRDEESGWGELFVKRQCCGAGTCRNIAPELLGAVPLAHEPPGGPAVLAGSHEEGAFTGVLRQPRSEAEFQAARTAVAACPFQALRLSPATRTRTGASPSPWRDWPQNLEEDVWALGHPSRANFGAQCYFIARSAGGVLVDPPQPSEDLYRWLAEHGGVRWLFLTHRDHTHHHREFAARFPGCERVIGAADVRPRERPYQPDTRAVEHQLADALAPLTLDGQRLPEEALPDTELVVLPQPGHTPGSLCLLYRGRFLFTGDHLGYARRLGHMVAPRIVCWEDWHRQTASVRYLAALAATGRLRFAWVLPGHGEWHRLPGEPLATAAAAALQSTVAWMERQAPGRTPLWRWVLFGMARSPKANPLGRALRFIGGEGPGSDAWVLPAGARPAVPGHDPARTTAAWQRLTLLGGVAAALSVLGYLALRRGTTVRSPRRGMRKPPLHL